MDGWMKRQTVSRAKIIKVSYSSDFLITDLFCGQGQRLCPDSQQCLDTNRCLSHNTVWTHRNVFHSMLLLKLLLSWSVSSAGHRQHCIYSHLSLMMWSSLYAGLFSFSLSTPLQLALPYAFRSFRTKIYNQGIYSELTDCLTEVVQIILHKLLLEMHWYLSAGQMKFNAILAIRMKI